MMLDSYDHVYDYYMKSNVFQDMDPYEKIVLLNNSMKWITPIFLIVQFASIPDMIQYLKRNLKSHEEAVSSNNGTLFHAVCYDNLEQGKERIKILLEDFNFSVDITDGAGRTACFYSMDDDVLDTLIHHYGASLTFRDKDNLTPGCYWIRNFRYYKWKYVDFFISQNYNEELMDEILNSQNYWFMHVIKDKWSFLTRIQKFEYYIYSGYCNYDFSNNAFEKAKTIIEELPIEDPLHLSEYLINYFTMKCEDSCNQIQFILNSLVRESSLENYAFVKYIEMIVTHFKTDFIFIDNIMRKMYTMKSYLSSHLDYLECLIQNYDDIVFEQKLHFIAKWIKLCFYESDELWSRIIHFEDMNFDTILYHAAVKVQIEARKKDKEFLIRCLKLKANANYKDSDGTPMYFYFTDHDWIFDLLLKQGIHSDAVNKRNQLSSRKLKPKDKMRSLQCFAASAIKNNSNLEKLPDPLVKFVSIHRPF